MPFAVTHVLLTIILVDLFRDYVVKNKRLFTLHTIFIAGLAGLLPDIDIPLNFFLNLLGGNLVHGTITHTPFFALLFLIPGLYLWHKKKHKTGVYFFVSSFGMMLHLTLDMLFRSDGSGVQFFYPISNAIFDFNLLSFLANADFFAGVDAIILLIWLWHEEKKHKISDFI